MSKKEKLDHQMHVAEQNMFNKKAVIDKVLDQYGSNKFTVGQAKSALLMYDINRWSEKKQRCDSDSLRKIKVQAKQKEEIGFQPGQFAPNDSLNKQFSKDP